MRDDRWTAASERWFTQLLRLYPADFRDTMGEALVEAYRDRAREALSRGGILPLAGVWLRALMDAIRNGIGERTTPAVSWRRGGNWGRDIELVTRRLVRAPMFVAVTVATLTVGLGMFAVVYTAVQKVLVAPMPFKDPEELYFVWRDYGTVTDLKRGALAASDIAELQRAGGVIEGAAGLAQYFGGIFSARAGAEPMEIPVTVVSPNIFELLGTPIAIGRGFAPNEVGPGRRGVIVLAYEMWNRLGADSSLVGSEVTLNGRQYTVIGVLPPKFALVRNEATGPPKRADAYVTFEYHVAQMQPNSAQFHSALIRVRHGIAPLRVTAAVGAVGRVIDRRDFNSRGLTLYPVGQKDDLVTPIKPALLVLGANGAAIMRATLGEGAALGLVGGALGALVAIWGTRALVALAPIDLPRREAIAIDWGIAAVVVTVGVLLGLVAATAPAIWAARAPLASLLAGSAVRGGGGHGRLRRGMVVVQVAFSLVLLSSGGLVVRSLEQLLKADPGFDSEGILTVRVRTPPEYFPLQSDIVAFQDRVQSALASLPGVIAASATSTLPLTAGGNQDVIGIPGAPGNTGDAKRDEVLVDVIGARAGFVDIMGMRLLAGRTFEPARRAGVPEVVIDNHLAQQFFPGGGAIGAKIPFGKSQLTIVGVVQQARLYDLHRDGRPQIYLRTEDWGYRPLFYVMRTERDPRSLLPDVRAAVRRIEPRVAVGDDRTMDEIVGNALRQQRTSATLITAFALGAVLLAAMGLFGVVAGSVTRRRLELAVRLALGADHHRVLRLVLGEGAVLVGLGILIAAPGIYVAGRLIQGTLVGVSPLDAITLAGGTVALALITMAHLLCTGATCAPHRAVAAASGGMNHDSVDRAAECRDDLCVSGPPVGTGEAPAAGSGSGIAHAQRDRRTGDPGRQEGFARDAGRQDGTA